VIDSYAEGIIEKAEFEPRLGRLRQRAAALAAQLDQIEAAAVGEQELRLIVGRLGEFAQQVQQGLAAADLITKRAIMQSVVKRVEVGLEQVTVVFRVTAGPFELRPNRGSVVDYAHYGERVNPGRFHGDMGTCSSEQPVGETEQISSDPTEGAELLVERAIRAGREQAGDHGALVDIEAACAGNDNIHRHPPRTGWTSNGGVCGIQTFCCVLPWMGATDGGAVRRPGSAFLRARGTSQLDLYRLP
jgi:hypothetical protein